MNMDDAYRTIAGFFLSSAVWFVVFALGGFILASSMVAPDLFLYKNIPWLMFGRVRPVHTNGMIFGFVGSALMGAMYYYVPRLVRAPLYSPLMGRLTLWMWNAGRGGGKRHPSSRS